MSAAPRRPLSFALRAAALAAPSLLTLLGLAALEAAVRAWLPPVVPLELLVRHPIDRDNFEDARSVSIFEADPLTFWRLRPGLDDVVWDFTLVSTNAQGLRHPRPLEPKPGGGIRIVALGDSVTFGYRVPVAFGGNPRTADRSQRPYPRLVEEALRAANPGRWIEVVPLAVPGHTSHQGRLWLEREIGRLEPSLVTACFGWNDQSLRAQPDAVAMDAGWPRPLLRGLLLRSQALMHASRALRRTGREPATGIAAPRVSREDYVENHLAIARLARAAGVPAVVIGPVYRDAVSLPPEAERMGSYRRALATRLLVERVPYLEVHALTEAAYPGNQRLFGELLHPNAEGHALLARALVAFLEREGLLRELGLRREAGP